MLILRLQIKYNLYGNVIVTSLEASHERASYFYHTIRHEPKQEVINRQATFKLKASAVDTLCKLHPSGTGQASWVFVRQVLYDMFISEYFL